MAETWHKITKTYRGGHSEFQIAVPQGVRLTRNDWNEILEWLGENTSGGHNYGYELRRRRLDARQQLS